MPATPAQRERILAFYDGISRWMRSAVESLTDEVDATFASGRAVLEAMLDELPYLDRPGHTMANSTFACAAVLAVFEVLRASDIDAHTWGRAIHALRTVGQQADEAAREAERLRSVEEAEASQSGAAANEFVFEILGPDEKSERGMNITSCAICHLYGQHDAIELVPYMCSLDDVMSDAGNQGLRRTGTIALGADCCDFRFQPGDPLRLAEQFPDRIRVRNS